MSKPDPASASTFDPAKFEYPLQVGGIRTGSLDAPGAGGGQSVRVAFVDTGAGLRFTVALDRGGDLVDAAFRGHNLAYLSPCGLLPPSPARHLGCEWLAGWPGGLLTTCGPRSIGGPREEDGATTSLHGHHSNTPACVERIVNPDPRRGRLAMSLDLVIRSARMFGPVIEVRRQIRCTLGRPEIDLVDEVVNLGDIPTAHHWLYHCNFGYPLLDAGSRHYYRGTAAYWEFPARSAARQPGAAALQALKRVPAPLAAHAGGNERGVILDVVPDHAGRGHAALVNPRLGIGVALSFPVKELPRLANWQHYGPAGAYVSGLEPFSGSLFGAARDRHSTATQRLEPGESRHYHLTLRAFAGAAELRAAAALADGALTPAPPAL